MVSEGGGALVGPDEGGDEPVALARQLPGVAVVVARRRAQAGRAAESLGADVFLLDDGYQHLAVKRDVDLLLLDARNPFAGARFPPFGRLREPLSALARADAFVFTRAEGDFPTPAAIRTVREYNSVAPIFTARIRPTGLRDEAGAPLEESGLADRRFVAVCGICGRQRKSFGIKSRAPITVVKIYFARSRSAAWYCCSADYQQIQSATRTHADGFAAIAALVPSSRTRMPAD